MSELVKLDKKQQLQIRSILDLPPTQMVEQVALMANVLNDVIEQQKMYIVLNGKKYVTVDGWCTLGTMLGVFPAERDVNETSNGWHAKVDLVNKNSGVVVGSASAICSRDERSWKDRPAYAVRSMAITRATGKAYRLAFSWIMNMAGYQTTPAEEMPSEDQTFETKYARPNADVKATAKDTTIEAEVTAKKEGYDPHNKVHQDFLMKELELKSIPLVYWDTIGNKLTGKSMKDLEAIIKEVIS